MSAEITTGKKLLRALLIEDSPLDAELLWRFLQKSHFEVQHQRIDDAIQLSHALETGVWDIVLCDFNLPGFSWLEALKMIKEKNLETPFIIVSGHIGEEVAVEAMRQGAHDYVMKNNLARLLPALDRELREAENRRERNRIADEKRYLAAIVDSSDDAIIGQRLDGIVSAWNAGAEKIFGYTAKEVKSHSIFRIIPQVCHDELRAIFQKISRGEKIERYETVREHKDGRMLDVSLTVSPIKNAAGQIIGASTIARDITERKQGEAERMKMLDQLTIALDQVKTLRGLLPVCQDCRRIRDDDGKWQVVETYINDHSEAACTQCICPECQANFHPELFAK